MVGRGWIEACRGRVGLAAVVVGLVGREVGVMSVLAGSTGARAFSGGSGRQG